MLYFITRIFWVLNCYNSCKLTSKIRLRKEAISNESHISLILFKSSNKSIEDEQHQDRPILSKSIY